MSNVESVVNGEERFKIVNTVRSRFNRVQRAQHPAHARLKQHIAAGEHRVLRSRPIIMGANEIQKHIKEIGDKARLGVIQVQTLDGRVIDPELLRAEKPPTLADAPPIPPVVPIPHPPLDSANRDKKIGEPMPQMPGGIPLSQLISEGGNITTGGIPGPLENEKTSADSEAEDPAEDDELNDPAEG